MHSIGRKRLARASRSFFILVLFASTSPAQPTALKAEGEAEMEKPGRFEELLVRDRVEADGASKRWQRNTITLLTAGAVAQYSQIGVAFFEANQKASLDRIEVTKPDGRVLDLTATAPTDVAPVFPPNLPIFSDLRLLRAAVPSLEVGDRLSFESTVRIEPLTGDEVWNEMEFAPRDEIELQVYELDVPEGSRLSVAVEPGLEAALDERREGGRWIRRWRLEGTRPGSAADAPQDDEADADEEVEETVDIQVSSFASWDELARWWSSLAPPEVDAAVEAKAAELTRGLVKPRDQLKAIHRFVAQEIRYLTLPLGLGRFRAREPKEILATGLGDCKDKVRLLASLAASAGIHVDSVLVHASSKRKLVEGLASPLQFDHVVARARIGAEEVWLDPTSEMTAFGNLPANVRGIRGVAIAAPAKDRRKAPQTQVVSTPGGSERFSSRAETVGSVDANGLIKVRETWTFDGDVESLRLVFKYGDGPTKEGVGRYLASEWDKKSKVEPPTSSAPSDLDAPFKVDYGVEWPMSPAIWKKAWTFWIPVAEIEFSKPPKDDDEQSKRREEVKLNAQKHQVRIARIEMPEGVSISPPVPVSARREFADYRSDYRVEGRTLIVERELTVKADSVPREKFDELGKLYDLIAQDEKQEFDVAAAPQLVPEGSETADDLHSQCWNALEEDRDAEAEVVCRRATELDPDHEFAWFRLGNALNQLGRYDEAEKAYRKQLEIEPNHEWAYGGLARVEWRRGNLAAAEKLLRQQVEIAPLVANGLSNLGGLLVQRGKLDEGETYLRQAYKLDPKDEWTVEEIFEVEARRGRLDGLAVLAAKHPELPRKLDRRLRVLELAVGSGKGSWAPLTTWTRAARADAERRLESFEGTPDADAIEAVWALALSWEVEGRVALEEGRPADAAPLFQAARAVTGSESALKGWSTAKQALASGGAAQRPKRASDVEAMNLVKRRLLGAAGAQGELWLVFGPDGTLSAATPVEPNGPKAIAASLLSDPLTIALPAENRAHIPIKLLAYCSPTADCDLTLERPSQTWRDADRP